MSILCPKNRVNTILNDQQKMIVEAGLEDSKVIGNPGVGKTTVMIHKIAWLFKNKILQSKRSFLITTFTVNACNEFIEKSRKDAINEKDLFSNLNVSTIHSLAGRIYNKWGSHRSCDKGTIVSATTNLMKTKTIEELKQIPCLCNLQLIIVDEAQDINQAQYDFLIEIKTKLQCVLILIGDPNQNIFQFQGGSDHFMLDFPGKIYYLTINNRSTPSIVRFANYFRPNQNLPEMTTSRKEDRHQPIEIYRIGDDQMTDKIVDIIKELKVDLSEVAIIGPVKKSRRLFNSYTNIGLSIFENLLTMYDIPFVQHYSTKGNENTTREKVSRSRGKINLHTIHSSKGDEFHTVILLNFHFFTQGRRPTYEAYNHFMYQWWTGITRARNRLIIIMDPHKDHWPLLQLVPTELYTLVGSPIKEKVFEVDVPLDVKKYSIVQLMDDLRNNDLYNLQQLLDHSIHIKQIAAKNIPTEHVTEYASLLEEHVRLVFFYCAYKKNNILPAFWRNLKEQFDTRINIPKSFKKSCFKMLQTLGHPSKERSITLEEVYTYKDKWEDDNGKDLYYYLVSRLKLTKVYMLSFEDDLVYKNDTMMSKWIDDMKEIKPLEQIFRKLFYISLYIFQYENEKKYLWNNRNAISDKIYKFDYLVQTIQECVDHCIDDDVHFNHLTCHPNLSFKGEVDIYKPRKKEIYSIVFQSSIQSRDVYQLLLNYHNIYPLLDNDISLYVINLYDGTCHYITDVRIERLHLLKFLCSTTDQKLKNSKILYSIHKNDKEDEVTEYFFYEHCLQLPIRPYNDYTSNIDFIKNLCDPVFIGFKHLDLFEDFLTRDIGKIIRSLDKTIRYNNIVKMYNKIFSTTRSNNNTCQEEVLMISQIIDHMGIVSKKLI
jgi:DNA polymerase III delta prime subunit